MLPDKRFIALAAALCAGAAGGAHAEPKLPATMVWTSYDLGSSGYVEASGMANAIMKHHPDVRVRILPSGTSIGRLLPLTQGKASFGFLASEVNFAAEGTYDFAVPNWGPQDIRVALARPASAGLAVAKDTGVKTMADLKGKRIGYVKGNPSVNVKSDAYLAFGGLTRDDVQVIWYGSYAALKNAIVANQLDAMSSVTTSANMREIEASPRGLVWPPFPAEDKEGWARLRKVVDFYEPYVETQGAAVSKENPVVLVGLRYPIITTYAKTSADEVYALVKAVDEAFGDIKDITPSAWQWEVKRSGRPPADTAWHEGTVRYMKEKGWWRPEDEAWQERRLERLKKVEEGWKKARAEFEAWAEKEKKAGHAVDEAQAWPDFWDGYREKNLPLG